MTQIWAIQSKLGKEDATLQLVDAFLKLGLSWAAFPLVPFDHHVPDLRWDGPIMYYGSCGLIQRVSSTPELAEKARLFYSKETHSPSGYGPKLGKQWLNADAQFITVGEILAMAPSDEPFFVRPDSGVKTFAGQVDSLRSIRDTLERFRHNGPLTLDTTVVMGRTIPIAQEYRTWVVDGEVDVVVGYKEGVRVVGWIPEGDEREEIRRYAEESAKLLSHLEVFTLDVARLHDGTLRVVEINDVHASGFYRPEIILDVVAGVSNYIARTS